MSFISHARRPSFDSLGLALALMCVLVGCGTGERRELSALECQSTRDEDDDGLIDCDDPDCWAHDFCSAFALQKEQDASAATRDAGGTKPPPKDASMSMSEDDAGATPTVDAGPVVDPCAGVQCQRDYYCNAQGTCERGDYPIELELQLSSAAVSLANAVSSCWDITCDWMISIPNFVCSCPPDSYVTVLVNGVIAGQSTAIKDSLNPKWPTTEPWIPVTLARPSDVITFVVADYDTPATSDEIFTCRPSLENIKTANVLSCTKEFIAIQPVPGPKDGLFRVEANVRLRNEVQ